MMTLLILWVMVSTVTAPLVGAALGSRRPGAAGQFRPPAPFPRQANRASGRADDPR
jgi:hypothetical protein